MGRSETVRAVQVNKEPVVRLASLFGGTIRRYIPKQPNHNPVWVWECSGARARGVMYTLYTLMSRKRQKQIGKALRLGG